MYFKSMQILVIFFTFSLTTLLSCRNRDSADLLGTESQTKVDIANCTFYLALGQTNSDSVKVQLRTYNQKADAFTQRDTLENQVIARNLKNFEYQENEWDLTNGTFLSRDKGRVQNLPEFLNGKEFIADVTEAVQKIEKEGEVGHLLNVSAKLQTKEKRVAKDHSWGALSVNLDSIPYYLPADYNKTNKLFPLRVPQTQSLSKYTGKNKLTQKVPDLASREEGKSHGLVGFGGPLPDAPLTDPYPVSIGLNLYRSCAK